MSCIKKSKIFPYFVMIIVYLYARKKKKEIMENSLFQLEKKKLHYNLIFVLKDFLI